MESEAELRAALWPDDYGRMLTDKKVLNDAITELVRLRQEKAALQKAHDYWKELYEKTNEALRKYQDGHIERETLIHVNNDLVREKAALTEALQLTQARLKVMRLEDMPLSGQRMLAEWTMRLEQQLAEARAEAVVMRTILAIIDKKMPPGPVRPFAGTVTLTPDNKWDIRHALSGTAGKAMLDRIAKLEKVAEASQRVRRESRSSIGLSKEAEVEWLLTLDDLKVQK